MNYIETIFLTGFPGFIAERLVARLAKADRKFYLLVQKNFVEKAQEITAKLARQENIPVENFSIVEGDITQKDLGIAPDDLQEIRQTTTSIFHLAAIYDLAVAEEIARLVNVKGTENVNDFAKTLKSLRRYNYISTCYVAGKREGVIFENELQHDAGFRNFYEETKYLAELAVEKLKTEIPTTIFRPSVVVGDSQTGETAKYDGIYYLIHYLRKSPSLLGLVNVGNKNVTLNLVPVDFVVKGIAALAFDEKATGKTIALADPNPQTTDEIFDEISFSLSKKKSVIKPPAAIIEKSLYLPVMPAISGLPHSAVPYFFIAQTYDTSNADELLKPHNVACPNFKDYIGNLVKFVNENPKL